MSEKLRAAAQAALEWLRDERSDTWTFMGRQFYKDRYKHTKALEAALVEYTTPLYTAPPRREWVGLTDEEIQTIHNTYYRRMGPKEFTKEIEAKLREKNT
jgi:hypothetical protein